MNEVKNNPPRVIFTSKLCYVESADDSYCHVQHAESFEDIQEAGKAIRKGGGPAIFRLGACR